MAVGNYALPPQTALEIHDPLVAEKWKRFKRAWTNYSLATGLDKKDEAVQVATLLTVIGEEAQEVFSTFGDWAAEGDAAKIKPVLAKFDSYCEPRKNVPFERYRFNRRVQEPGETYDQYRTSLRKLADGCEFATITPDEILRDRLVFGIRDAKVRERLLRETKLTLTKTDEICHAAESMMVQMKVVEDVHDAAAVGIHPDSLEKERPHNPEQRRTRDCWNCGRKHEYHRKEFCPAYGNTCNKCHKLNHFASKCRGKSKPQPIRTIEDADEIFQIAALDLDDSQCITVKLESENHICFQADTGAQCNVLPLAIYKKGTRDVTLSNVVPTNTQVRAYGGATLPVVGSTLLRVSRGKIRCRLNCKLVDREDVRPLLGRKACLGMKIVSYLDNDQLSQPSTGESTVYKVDNATPVATRQLIKSYPKVFSDGVGLLQGHYHIRLDSNAVPVQHAPWRVPVPLRARLKETLDDLVRQEILAPVEQPTPWISSMVVVPKKDGTLRICLDPKDLNKAVQREHYPLPTIEDIATRLHGAKVFSILDVSKGFWHVLLDEPSSFLTTFHTPFGRCRWRRMPFGICSAPEVFQRRMHELIEGLQGVEVVADDFVVVGLGETKESAVRNHDDNLQGFLQRCEERWVKLNARKARLRMSEVPFIGHVATPEGLCVDPAKVRAIKEMPPPVDIAGIQRLLGLAQYLSKFLPHLSDMTKPLRELTQKDMEWTWDQPQKQALDNLKRAVTNTPVLRYYNLDEEVTIQCDSSQSGLGAALMQNGQPVAYASRALTPAEMRYAQIEKELLAIVFACERFEAYIYGRQIVRVETDHQPLELIVKKPLNSAPTRLQRMLLRLQRYCLDVTYKKGKQMYLADTLSRAYLTETHACGISKALENVDHTTSLAITKERLLQIQYASTDDPVLVELRQVVMSGWPDRRAEVPEMLRAYYDFCDELTVQDQLVFKGQMLIVPAGMRKEMLAVAHATHIGMEGCLRRAREIMFWPRMATELKEYISKCDICTRHRESQSKEPHSSRMMWRPGLGQKWELTCAT